MSAKAKIITLVVVFIICLGMVVYGTISDETPIIDVLPRLILMVLTAVVLIIRIVSSSSAKRSMTGTKRIEDIWQIEEKENFIAELNLYIAEKCEYGDNIEILNDEQRVLYITQALEEEVNNGGFSQFFFNSAGAFANELVASFEKIGAIKTAEICKKAISVFGAKVPTDRAEREDVISPDDEKEEERIEEFLNECDDAFFEYEDDLVELNYQFVINNKASFID